MTHTYIILRISKRAFNEIKKKLADAGYEHTFHQENGETVIDMHGIAVADQTNDSN